MIEARSQHHVEQLRLLLSISSLRVTQFRYNLFIEFDLTLQERVHHFAVVADLKIVTIYYQYYR